MRLIRVIFINMKRHIKNPLMWAISFLLPMIVLVGMAKAPDDMSGGHIGVICNDNSAYSQELVNELEGKYTIKEYEGTPEDNYSELRKNNVGAIYVIENGFGETLESGRIPEVKVYKTEEGIGSVIGDEIIENYINNKLEEEVKEGLSTNYIETIIEDNVVEDDSQFIMTLMMICYFMMIGGSVITEDIIKLRNQKVLKRTISTANKDYEILGGIFLSIFFLQAILSTIAFLITSKIVGLHSYNILSTILVIVLCSLISTTIVVCVTRWLKNPIITSLATVIFGLLCFGISMVSMNLDSFENVPKIIEKLSIISPFTWMIKIVQNNQYIVPSIVIIFMSLVFFTAGSFRLRDYAKE